MRRTIGKRKRNSLCGIMECRIINGTTVQIKMLFGCLMRRRINESRMAIPIGKNE